MKVGTEEVVSEPQHTRDLAKWAAELRFEDLPEELVAKATASIQDCVALCLYVGRQTEWGRSIAEYAVEQSSASPASKCSVIGHRRVKSPEQAALANGTMALGLEFEDVHLGSGSHPYATIVPALLAIAELVGSSGKDVITACVAAHEVATRIGTASLTRLKDGSYMTWSRGIYTQQTFNVFGAAVAAGFLLGLGTEDMAMALGMAGEQAAGTQQSHGEGAWSRRLHGGLAAANGVRAALLAKKGFSGPKNFLEGKYGLYNAFDLEFNEDRLLGKLGEEWEYLDTWFKAYPSYTISHSMIESVLKLRDEHDISPGDVKRIVGHQVQWTQWHLRKDFPTMVTAQYGPRFLLSIALFKGEFGLDAVQDAVLADAAIQEFASNKVELVLDPKYTAMFREGKRPRTAPGSAVIELKDGREFQHEVEYPLGSSGNPQSEDQLRTKFESLVRASGMLDDSKMGELYQAVHQLRRGGEVARLTEFMTVGTK